MLTFQFLAEDGTTDAVIEPLSQGHIIVSGQDGVCSTLALNKSVFLVLAITELMDGIHSLLSTPEKQFTFNVYGTPLGLNILKQKHGFTLYCGGRNIKQNKIAEATREELIDAVSVAVTNFRKIYRVNSLKADEIRNERVVALWDRDTNDMFGQAIEQWMNTFRV